VTRAVSHSNTAGPSEGHRSPAPLAANAKQKSASMAFAVDQSSAPPSKRFKNAVRLMSTASIKTISFLAAP
jgi:hypothetical protein